MLAAITDPAAPRLVRLKITREMIEAKQVEVRTPFDAPDRIVLSQLRTIDAKTQHAHLLVTPRSTPWSSRLYAARSLIGDARDLLCNVLEEAFGVTTVSALRCTRDAESSSLTAFDPGAQLIIHVGDTMFAREILQAAMYRTRGGASRTDWNGWLDALDGDGYVWLCLREPDLIAERKVRPVVFPISTGLVEPFPFLDNNTSRTHLILVGGSPYGTYFGVARFLQQYLGACWAFPGKDGAIIPRVSGDLHPMEFIHRIEEPAVRSRTFAAFTHGGSDGHEVWERDEMRSWMLRNRIHPNTLRAEILELSGTSVPGYPMAPLCTDASDAELQAFFLAMLRSEERVPASHALAEYLSPQLPSTVVPGSIETLRPLPPLLEGRSTTSFVGVPRYDADSMRNVYPDLRQRNFATNEPRLAQGLGDLNDGDRFPRESKTDPCGDHYAIAPLRGERVPYVLKRMPNFSDALLDATTYDTSRRYRRFVPVCTPLRIDGPMWPDSSWQPCIFEDDGSSSVGRLFSVHPMLRADLVSQILIAGLVPRSYSGFGMENAFSITPNDGNRWCNCHACTHADEIGGAGGSLMVLLGNIITTNRGDLELDARAATPPRMVSWSTTDPLHSSTLSEDELCMRGIVYNSGYSSQRSRASSHCALRSRG